MFDDSWIGERRAELAEKERRGETITWRERRMVTHPPVPGPSSDAERTMEARVRQKLTSREPLDADEREYFAHLPGDKQP